MCFIFQGHFGLSQAEELEMAIDQCKELIRKATPHSDRQKNLVQKLVQLRLKLQEMKVWQKWVCVCVRERERERKRKRQTDKWTDGQTDRQTERQLGDACAVMYTCMYVDVHVCVCVCVCVCSWPRQVNASKKIHPACTIHENTMWPFLNGWIENGHVGKNLTKMVNPRDVVGERRRRTLTEVFVGDVWATGSISRKLFSHACLTFHKPLTLEFFKGRFLLAKQQVF